MCTGIIQSSGWPAAVAIMGNWFGRNRYMYMYVLCIVRDNSIIPILSPTLSCFMSVIIAMGWYLESGVPMHL